MFQILKQHVKYTFVFKDDSIVRAKYMWGIKSDNIAWIKVYFDDQTIQIFREEDLKYVYTEET